MSAQDDTPNEDTIWDPLQGPLPQGQNPSPREDPEQRLLLFCQRDGAAHCTMPCCGPLPEAFANLLHMVKDAHGNGVPKQESPAKLEIYRRQCFHRSLRKKLPWARLQSDAAKNKLKEVHPGQDHLQDHRPSACRPADLRKASMLWAGLGSGTRGGKGWGGLGCQEIRHSTVVVAGLATSWPLTAPARGVVSISSRYARSLA